MTPVIIGVSVAFILFVGVVHPIWCMVDVSKNPYRGRFAKFLIWVLITLTAGVGSVLYGLFGAYSKGLRVVTILTLMALPVIGAAVMYLIGQDQSIMRDISGFFPQ